MTTDQRKGINTYARPRGSDNYNTPDTFRAALDHEFHFDSYDPCPINERGLREYDGNTDTPAWVQCYYMNPPYSDPKPWLVLARRDQLRGKTVVVLLRGDTSTAWFHEGVLPFAELRFIHGRLKFNGKPAPFASLLAVFRPFQSPGIKPTGVIEQ